MKNLALCVCVLFPFSVVAETSNVASVGITLKNLVEQGGEVERTHEYFGENIRVNLGNFRDCSPGKVIARAMINEETILQATIENHEGWYEVGVNLDLRNEYKVNLLIHCNEGIPYRVVWLERANA